MYLQLVSTPGVKPQLHKRSGHFNFTQWKLSCSQNIIMIKKILIYIYFAGGRISRPASKYPRNNKVENLRSSCALWWTSIVTLCLYTFITAKFKAWLSCLLIKNFNHTPNHARVSISHAWYKCLSHCSIDCLILKNILII